MCRPRNSDQAIPHHAPRAETGVPTPTIAAAFPRDPSGAASATRNRSFWRKGKRAAREIGLDLNDPSVANPIARSGPSEMQKRSLAECAVSARCREVAVAREMLVPFAEQVSEDRDHAAGLRLWGPRPPRDCSRRDR